jgi:UDPglucose--hexose-1-phosphate uridylyltransferase
MTPAEVYAVRPGNSSPNSPDWLLRVIPNKFPALRIEGSLNKEGVGLYDRMNGIGAHEVIIDTPVHGETLSNMSVRSIQNIFGAFKERVLDLAKDKRFRFTIVFKNHGTIAGASLDHSHSQLISLPVVPKRISEEISGSMNYYRQKDRCIFCDIIAQEQEDNVRVIYENKRFISLSPYASRFPFESWILPKNHESHFVFSSDDDGYRDAADALSMVLKKQDKVLNSPPYNFMIHTAPLGSGDMPYYHWHIEIIPRLTKMAGFEWGTGFYINPTPPEEATTYLKEADI